LRIRFSPVWADSLGAKSFCTLVETSDVRILVDPGVAIMHGSFPAPLDMKVRWTEEGYERIVEAAQRADVVVVTHYHYDHFTDFDEELYRGRLIIAKSPNRYVNDSQRGRALRFFTHLFGMAGLDLDSLMEDPVEEEYPDPMDGLPHASSKSYGDYQSRKKELLEKGLKWFLSRARKWCGYRRIPEYDSGFFRLRFADGGKFVFGDTVLRFTEPLFHGVEFSRVGWVVGLVIEYGGDKLLFSSDLNGPIIEDYADWIIRERPDILLLDGPATYTFGYMLNRINLGRAAENICRIIAEATPSLVLLDHHLLREPRYRERLADVYRLARKEGVELLSVAEYLGGTPAVLQFLN